MTINPDHYNPTPDLKPASEPFLRTVTFAHERLWVDFLQWLDARGLHTFPYPDDMQPGNAEIRHGIGIS